MKAFARLYEELDATTGTNKKVEAIAEYFRTAPPDDAAWVLFFLTGRRLKRLISSRALREWTLELAQIPEWLFEESYASVGDTAEVCALLLDAMAPGRHDDAEDLSLAKWMEDRIVPLLGADEAEQKAAVTSWWKTLDRHGTFVLNKLLTGAFRVGVSQSIVTRALSSLSGLSLPEVSHRLMGDWQPTGEWYSQLLTPGETERTNSKPYPFFLASPLEKEIAELGSPKDWLAEWKWDGIRAQVIKRGGEVHVWSRGEELITERFPEIVQGAQTLPEGTVLDGEILAMRDRKVLPFAILQKRIGRKTLSKAILTEAPAGLMVYDCLELDGKDMREEPMRARREALENLIAGRSRVFEISPRIEFDSWQDLGTLRTTSRERGVEGVMLKHIESPYQSGRRRGDWWKWKIDPYTIDAVLIYAQAGSGRRANLFTDYTFALWNDKELVPVAKAYSGLSNEEIAELDNWIRANTRERFGPVRSVTPHHVFELAFEGIAASPRHKSGVAVRFPRIHRWRKDKKIADADQLSTLKAMIDAANPAQHDSNSNPAP